MNVVPARNVQQALPLACQMLSTIGVRRNSRNGPVLMSPVPVTTAYERPTERVLFWAARDANPFFHLYESLWMLGGRNDLAPLQQLVGRMATFSDDGETLHGAYGKRWRNHFRINAAGGLTDQLAVIIARLAANPDDRRCVLQMWDPATDLNHAGRDVPCNLLATFQVNANGALDMMVSNRSNDVVWGCYGANAVHFSFLQEYVAISAGLPIGHYWQVSANWHGYVDVFEPLSAALGDHFNTELAKLMEVVGPGENEATRGMKVLEMNDPYALDEVEPYPLMQECREQWDRDLSVFLRTRGLQGYYRDPFFTDVAAPLMWTYTVYRQTDGDVKFDAALERLQTCQASDWKRAAEEWILRRKARWNREKDDGPSPG